MDFFYAKLFLVLIFLPCTLAALMPNRWWLAGYTLMVGAVITWLYIDIRALYNADPAYDPGVFGSVAHYAFYVSIWIFALAVAARDWGLRLRARGESRRTVYMASYSVLTIVTTLYLSMEAHNAWRY